MNRHQRPTRLIRASDDLLTMFGTRTAEGRALTAEWGEPIGHNAETDEYIYEPVFTQTDDGFTLVRSDDLLDIARMAGADLSDIDHAGQLVHPPLIDFVAGAVRDLRDDYRECLAEVAKEPATAHREVAE